MKMEKNQIIWIVVVLIAAAIAGCLIYFDWQLSGSTMGDFMVTESGAADWEMVKYTKNMDIWFMLFMVAFLMMFIKKFEWGVALGDRKSTRLNSSH